MKCRHCNSQLNHSLIDLGSSPPSNSYLSEIVNFETWYPLRVLLCEICWLVQTEDFVGTEEMFSNDYAYFSSFSSTWLEHTKKFVEKILNKFALDQFSQVVEVASNDGYLLQYIQSRGIPNYGIEPTQSTANAARAKGLDIIQEFFGLRLAEKLTSQGRQADLIVANNVLAHVPSINDFVQGFSVLLKKNGIATFEFPHLVNLLENNLFDTIYHEHYSYLSLAAVSRIFTKNGLTIFDVEKIPTHGGSLRVFAQRSDSNRHSLTPAVYKVMEEEDKMGIQNLSYYAGFQSRCLDIKIQLLEFIVNAKRSGKKIAGYGAAAKGNTLLNYTGVRADLIPYVVDLNPAKQGCLMPGSRIPIVSENVLKNDQPDYILIFPWNLKKEIVHQLEYARAWDAKFVTAIPKLDVI